MMDVEVSVLLSTAPECSGMLNKVGQVHSHMSKRHVSLAQATGRGIPADALCCTLTMSSSRPVSSVSTNPPDIVTAPQTPAPTTPLLDPGPGSHVPTPEQSNLPLPEADSQNTPENPEPLPLVSTLTPHQPDAPLPEADAQDIRQATPPKSLTPIPTDTHTPLPTDDILLPPMAPYLAPPLSDTSTPRDSYGPASFNDSSQRLAAEKATDLSADEFDQPQKRTSIFRRPVFWLAAAAALVLLILAVILPVYFTVIKKNNNGAAASSSSSSGGAPQPTASGQPGSPTVAITGGDGSTITTATGASFTYKNPFGGFC
jgi:hypothetical protein